jgi:DNA sulfur modification protein DndB
LDVEGDHTDFGIEEKTMDLSFPAMRFKMGGRKMYSATAEAPSLVQLAAKPNEWNPLATTPHGNRIRSKEHVRGIVDYLLEEEDPILGAIVLYANPEDIRTEELEVNGIGGELVMLHMRVGAKFDIGDGQHRVAALADALEAVSDRDEDDPLRQKLERFTVPLLINPDADAVRRAQDFTDLQRNSKPPAGSLGASMDRRHPINRFTLEVAKAVALFDDGNRIEYHKDTLGKLSTRLYTFQAFRQGVMVLLGAGNERTRAGVEKAADEALDGSYDAEFKRIKGIFEACQQGLPGWKELHAGSIEVPKFRELYIHSTAAGFYALCLGIYKAEQQGVGMDKAVDAFAGVDWERPTGPSFWDGSLIVVQEQPDGTDRRKMSAGRTAYEEAGERLAAVATEKAPEPTKKAQEPAGAAA